MGGKRGCALSLAFGFHVVGLASLIGGCVTPFWSRIEDKVSGNVTLNVGIFTSYVPNGDWSFRDFEEFKKVGYDDTALYGMLSVIFAFITIFLQLSLVEAFALALYNSSCGHWYNPDILLIFSLISGFTGVTCLVLFEQYIVRFLADNNGVTAKMEFSRGFVIFFIATAFIAAFLTVCDRTTHAKPNSENNRVKTK